MKRKHGGPRHGAGRPSSPWNKITLAERYAGLKYEFVMAGDRAPSKRALEIVHAELHPDGRGELETTRKLIRRGRGWGNYIDEIRDEPDVSRRTQMLEDLGLSWQQRQRRRHRRES
jgi:hypothetical protein